MQIRVKLESFQVPPKNGKITSGLAHDLLDHSSNEHGLFCEEVAALGGACFTRNFGLQLYNPLNRPFAEILATDLVGSFRDDETMNQSPRYWLTKAEDVRLTQLLADMRPHAIKYYEAEFTDYQEDEFINLCADDAYWNSLCDWLKYGYYRTKRRFKGDFDAAHATFQAIGRAVERVWSTLLDYADSGAEFTLALDYDNGYVRVDGEYI
jgi:hypothetical protein